MLWRNEDEVDFVTRPPTPERLAGPHPALMDAGLSRPRGVTVACVSRRGGLGRSSMLREFGAAWARQGKRVLLADLDPVQSLKRMLAGNARAAAVVPWSGVHGELVIHRAENGGELRLLTGLRGATATDLRSALDAARAQADVVLLDTAPADTGPETWFAEEVADAVIACFGDGERLFGRHETVYSDRYRPIYERQQQHTAMLKWLDKAFDAYFDDSWGEEQTDDELLTQLEWIEEHRRTFLVTVADKGRQLFGPAWDPDRWIDYQRAQEDDWRDDEPEEQEVPAESGDEPQPGDITVVYRPYDDREVIAPDQ
ncbi:ParA family protein [Amycolatopsis rubida]|uniref:CobQ/CobB/MinD/ParA nucleotide binding domain-containing protein n=1 Tax=Amycolatopsis rubida TaxID=112413 RepID=A0A1I5XEC1_9PSEU|nr:division plane positioning ATPase MipZ [Amycolatopsis rubida]SFQ30156.1 CobQ/CobB/MinD/ParA nucleotide binding domain-containing protein [Amycolatopsis rubida]